MIRLLFCFLLITSSLCHAGVYGSLEFGDSRDTVLSKLQKSKLVDQAIDTSLLGRTGLNGVFRCKNKLAGQTYTLYFAWTDTGRLKEITLKSSRLPHGEHSGKLREAWEKANSLFTQVYGNPVQDADFPSQDQFKGDGMMMSHIWHKGAKQSILIGPGVEQGKCYLAIRFINQRVEPVRIP